MLAWQVGMVFQNGALFDSLSVGENVGFLLYEHTSLPKRRIQVFPDGTPPEPSWSGSQLRPICRCSPVSVMLAVGPRVDHGAGGWHASRQACLPCLSIFGCRSPILLVKTAFITLLVRKTCSQACLQVLLVPLRVCLAMRSTRHFLLG